jgi:hypothetical protein
MYAPYEEAARNRSPIMKVLIRKWDYRYPRVFVAVHFAAAIWLLFLGTVLCAVDWWQWGVLALAGALTHAAVGYRVAATTFMVGSRPAATESSVDSRPMATTV